MLVNTIEEHLTKRITNGELSNNDLVQLIELVGSYLNLTTIADYARQNKLRHVTKIFNVKFVIDNN